MRRMRADKASEQISPLRGLASGPVCIHCEGIERDRPFCKTRPGILQFQAGSARGMAIANAERMITGLKKNASGALRTVVFKIIIDQDGVVDSHECAESDLRYNVGTFGGALM